MVQIGCPPRIIKTTIRKKNKFFFSSNFFLLMPPTFFSLDFLWEITKEFSNLNKVHKVNEDLFEQSFPFSLIIDYLKFFKFF